MHGLAAPAAGDTEGNFDRWKRIGALRVETVAERLFELAVGVEIDRARIDGDGVGNVFTEIKTGDGKRLFAAPMADARIAGDLFIDLGAGGDEFQAVRPAHRNVIRGEFGLIAEVGIPAFAGADEEHIVACVFDDAAAITKMNR